MHPTVELLLSDPNPWTPPWPLPGAIETERLTLRFFGADDAPRLLAAVDRDRDALLPWMAWAKIDNRSVAECHYNIERLRRMRKDPECTEYVIGIFDKATGEVAGGTGLQHIDPSGRAAEIGYWIRPDLWGKGLATESTAALITAAMTPTSEGGWGFRRITIHCGVENVASAAVPRKLGMRLEVRARKQRWLDPVGYVDVLGFAVLAEEWDFARRRALPGIIEEGWPPPGGHGRRP